jgi:uncharacterized protein (DUF2267 family)
MGKTVVNQSDIEKLFKVVQENVIDDYQDFEKVVQEVFAIYDDTEKELKLEEMLETVTDENRQELVDFGKPVGKELI